MTILDKAGLTINSKLLSLERVLTNHPFPKFIDPKISCPQAIVEMML